MLSLTSTYPQDNWVNQPPATQETGSWRRRQLSRGPPTPRCWSDFGVLSNAFQQLNEARRFVVSSMFMSTEEPCSHLILPLLCSCSDNGALIIQRAKLDTVLQTSPPHTALKASLGQKARGGEEGPCLPQLSSHSLERQKAAQGCGAAGLRAVIISLVLPPSSMGHSGSLPSNTQGPY